MNNVFFFKLFFVKKIKNYYLYFKHFRILKTFFISTSFCCLNNVYSLKTEKNEDENIKKEKIKAGKEIL